MSLYINTIANAALGPRRPNCLARAREYTEYLDKWGLIRKALKKNNLLLALLSPQFRAIGRASQCKKLGAKVWSK